MSVRNILWSGIAMLVAHAMLAPAASGEAQFIFRYKAGLIEPMNPVGGGETPEGPGLDNVAFEPIGEDSEEDANAPTPLALRMTSSSSVPNAERIVYQCFEASGGYGNYSFATMNYLEGDVSWVQDFDIVARSELSSPMGSHTDFAILRSYPSYEPNDDTFGVTADGEACLRFKVDQRVKDPEPAIAQFRVDDFPDPAISDESFPAWRVMTSGNYRNVTVSLDFSCSKGCVWLPPQSIVWITGPHTSLMGSGPNAFPFTAGGGSGEYTWSVTGENVEYDPSENSFAFHGYGPWSVSVTVTDSGGLSATKEYTFVEDPEKPRLCHYPHPVGWDVCRPM